VTDRPSLRANARELPVPAWFLFAGTFVNRFGSFVFVFLALYLTDQGYSPAEAGSAVSAYGAGSIAAAALGGLLADRLGRRRTIALSMFASAAAMLALSQAEALPVLVGLAAFAGLAAELYRPASGALLADLVPAGRRVTAFALYRFAINLGFAAGPATAGLLAERSFTLVFVGDAVTSCVFGTIALVALPEGGHAAAAEERRGELLRALRGDRAFALFLLATLAGSFVYMQQGASLPLHVHDAGLSTSVYGLLISLNGLLVILVELPLTGFTQRLPARPVIAAGFALVGLGFALTGLAETAPALAATVLVWTIGEIAYAPIAAAYVADLSPPHLRGRYQGAWAASFSAGLVVGPALGTALYGSRPELLWALCGALGLAAAALVLASPARSVAPEPVTLETP
jgi:MFS family permease